MSKKVLILGNYNNGIYHQMIDHFLAAGTIVYLVDVPDNKVKENVNVIYSKNYVSAVRRFLLRFLPGIINYIDLVSALSYFSVTLQFSRIRKFWHSPRIKRSIHNLILHSSVIENSNVDYTLCLNVYFYGFCAILTKSHKVVGQPWGSDVNKYGVSSPLRYFFMKRSLKSMKFIAPAGKSVIPFMITEYGLESKNFIFLPPTVDDTRFFMLTDAVKELRRKELGIHPNSIIFFSCRRFHLDWGSHIIKEIFLELAGKIPNSYFIILSGSNNNPLITQFISEVPEVNRNKFLFLNREVSLIEFSLYAQISDFAFSAMLNRDMQSSSIMQSAACGAIPVLLEQEEYRLLENEGLKMILFNLQRDTLFPTIIDFIEHKEHIELLRSQNRDFFLKRRNVLSYAKMLNEVAS